MANTVKRNSFQKAVDYMNDHINEVKQINGSGYDAYILFKIKMREHGITISDKVYEELIEYKYGVNYRISR